jgi:hypothetical protein
MKQAFSKIKYFIFNRLDERSTWRGIIAGVTVFGVSLSPEQTQAIISAGVSIGALLEMFVPDDDNKINVAFKKDNENINSKVISPLEKEELILEVDLDEQDKESSI